MKPALEPWAIAGVIDVALLLWTFCWPVPPPRGDFDPVLFITFVRRVCVAGAISIPAWMICLALQLGR
jgi:hypothetical protein